MRLVPLWRALSARLAEPLVTVGLYVLALTLVWASIGVHLAQERRQMISHRAEEAGNLARGFEENVVSAFSAVDQALLFVRRVQASQRDHFDIQFWTRDIAFLRTQAVQMSFANRAGVIVDSNLGPFTEPVDIADRDYFRTQRDSAGDHLFIGQRLLGRITHQLTVNVSRKVFDDAGEFAGIVMVSLAPEYLNGFYTSLEIGQGRLILAGTDGVIRACVPDLPQLDQPLPLDPMLMALARAGGESHSRVDEPSGRIVALRRVRGFPLVVAVDLPLDEALASYRQDRQEYLLVGAGVTTLLTAIWLLLLRTRRAALRSRQTLVSALQSISQGLMMVNAERRIAVINRRAIDLLGLPAELAQENASFDALCDWQAREEEFGKLGPGGFNHETYLLARRFSLDVGLYERERANGTVLEVRTNVLPDGSAVRTFTDITERRRNEQILRDARDAAEAGSRARTEFVAVMSHEIRTPLNGIIGVATLLADCPLGREEREHVQIIRESGEHLLTLVNDILDFSKLEVDRMELESRPFCLPAMLRRITGMLRPQATQKGLALVLDAPPELPEWVAGDENRLSQVLVNLVGNAIKFTPAGAVSVVVRVSDPGEVDAAFQFAVRDTGIGIPEDARGKLFKLFSQVDQSISRRFGGTGLGLAICQRLVGLMGGTIGVDSTPGQGSVFRFSVRLNLAAKPVAQAAPPPAVAARLRILLAEDNATNRLVATRLLTRKGHSVEVVADGAQAFERLRKDQYDLLLTDVMMPVMDGLELSRRIRALPPPLGRIPIIGLTARSSEEDRRDCKAAGMDDHVAKPIAPDELDRAIARTVGGSVQAPPPARQPAGDAFDRGRLELLEEAIGAEAVEEVIALFRAQIGPQLALLRSLESAGDGPGLVREVHALAGSARTIGLERLGATAKAWEDSLRGSGEPQSGSQLEVLATLVEEGLAWLSEARERATAPT